jgi:sugar-specific transcriptional regulator TrmB
MISDENIQTLMDFGLSYVQSLTYLTLVKLKKSDAKTIARVSTVARQDIYRIMPTLQKLGLVEKIIGVPTLYRATPIKNAITNLLENKKREYDTLIEKTDLLINNFPKSDEEISLGADDTQFVLISELSLLLKLHEKLTSDCQSTLDIMMPLSKYSRKAEEQWFRVNETVRQKNQIKIRLITEKPQDKETYFMFWKPLLKNPLFQIKYTTASIPVFMHIFDRKQFTLSVGKHEILPSLWSNNPNIVQLALTYFNKSW